ncbi:MAG: hypothetical protein A2231_01760 [Candidatus Firestonebacteria bacterium RIFOXYA2_FULL_40_8]|nr:MAG: hypothetical protein A2231_01760 [Candidatus Firestonebacteria bacterium RIFOXYA2_FULL_40_8]
MIVRRNFVTEFVIIFILLLCCLYGEGTEEDLLFRDIPTIYAAGKIEQKISEAAASVTVIDRVEINRWGYTKLSDVLSMVTGLYINNDRNYYYLGVRGFLTPGDYCSRTLVTVDGQVMNDVLYGTGFFNNEVDLGFVKKIEIIKGPGSALYGSNAMFAVINIVTVDYEKSKEFSASIVAGSFSTAGGSFSFNKNFGDGKKIFLGISGNHMEGQDLYFSEYDTPLNNNGIFSGGDKSREYNIVLKGAIGDLSLKGIIDLKTKYLPTGEYGTIFNDNRSKTIDNKYLFSIEYAPRLDLDKTLHIIAYNFNYFYHGDYFLSYSDSIGNPYVEKNTDDAFDNHYGLQAKLDWQTKENIFISGVELRNDYNLVQKNYDFGLTDTALFLDYLNDVRSGYVLSSYAQDIFNILPEASITAGARYDYYNNFGGTFNPRLGLILTPVKGAAIKILYGSAFRAPNVYELYYSTTTIFRPNPALIPENIKTYEIIFISNPVENTDVQVSFYRTDMTDIITQVTTNDIDTITGLNFIQYQNAGSVRALGIELEAAYKSNTFRSSFGVNVQKTENLTTGGDVTNSPEALGNFKIYLPLFASSGVGIETFFSGRRLEFNRPNWLSPFFVSNFVITSKEIINNMSISLRVQNVFDETYSDPVGGNFLQSSLMQNRRNFVIKAEYSF